MEVTVLLSCGRLRGREDAVVEARLVEEVVAVALQREDGAFGLYTVVPSLDGLDNFHVVSLCHCWHVVCLFLSIYQRIEQSFEFSVLFFKFFVLLGELLHGFDEQCSESLVAD